MDRSATEVRRPVREPTLLSDRHSSPCPSLCRGAPIVRADRPGVAMNEIFAGVRVLDVSQNTFAPAAAGLLADFGADVIRIEHPRRATPEGRKGYVHPSVDGVDLGMAQSN